MAATPAARRSTRVSEAPAATADWNHPPTAQSIAAARVAQRQARHAFTKMTGVHLDRSGRPILSHRLVQGRTR
jgi:hypothetical protein